MKHELPEGERGRFSENHLQSVTLPSRYYTDEGIYRLEMERIHQRSWCYVGHVSEVAEPGQYVTDYIAEQPVVIVRGRDGVIRAFFNVCQHRGHELLKGKGKIGGGIVCPYHAWFYEHDGTLRKARLTEHIANFDKSDYNLRALPIVSAAGLLFVNIDKDCRPFATEMDGLSETIYKHLPDIEDYVSVYNLTYDINANWKIVVDNFAEAYHIPVAHPQLAKVLNQGLDEFREEKRWSYFLYNCREGYEGLELEPGSPYIAWMGWPHLSMLSLPGSKNLLVLRMAPNGVDRCLERVDIYAPRGPVDPKLDAVKELFMDNFNQEDIAIVESVQRGISSLGFDQGRYVCDPDDSWFSEVPLHTFHTQVLEALAET